MLLRRRRCGAYGGKDLREALVADDPPPGRLHGFAVVALLDVGFGHGADGHQDVRDGVALFRGEGAGDDGGPQVREVGHRHQGRGHRFEPAGTDCGSRSRRRSGPSSVRTSSRPSPRTV